MEKKHSLIFPDFRKSICAEEKSQSGIAAAPKGKKLITNRGQVSDTTVTVKRTDFALYFGQVSPNKTGSECSFWNYWPFFLRHQEYDYQNVRSGQVISKETTRFVKGLTILNEGYNTISWYLNILSTKAVISFLDISWYLNILSRIQSSSGPQWSCNYIPLSLKEPSTGSMGSRRNLQKWQRNRVL